MARQLLAVAPVDLDLVGGRVPFFSPAATPPASKEGSERLRTMAKKMICVAPDVVQRRGTCTRKAVK
ncbi:unnamed protein product [Urochloa humidicola]